MKVKKGFNKFLTAMFLGFFLVSLTPLTILADSNNLKPKIANNEKKVNKKAIRALAIKRKQQELAKLNKKSGKNSTKKKRCWGHCCCSRYYVPANYDSDYPLEKACWENSSGNWYIYNYYNKRLYIIQFGLSGDIPIPADYDYDGIDEVAVYRPSTGECHISLDNKSWPDGAIVVPCR